MTILDTLAADSLLQGLVNGPEWRALQQVHRAATQRLRQVRTLPPTRRWA